MRRFLLTIRVPGMPTRKVHAIAKDSASALIAILDSLPDLAMVTVKPA